MSYDPLKEFYIDKPSVSNKDNMLGAIDMAHAQAEGDNRVIRSEFHVAIMTDEGGDIWTSIGFTHANFYAIDRAIQSLQGLKNKIELAAEGIIPSDELFDRYKKG